MTYTHQPVESIISKLKDLPAIRIVEHDLYAHAYKLFVNTDKEIKHDCDTIEELLDLVSDYLGLNFDISTQYDDENEELDGYKYSDTNELGVTYRVYKGAKLDAIPYAKYTEGPMTTDRDFYMYTQSNWPGDVESLYIAMLHSFGYSVDIKTTTYVYNEDMILANGFFDIKDEVDSGIVGLSY